jgi:hypothetical protein
MGCQALASRNWYCITPKYHSIDAISEKHLGDDHPSTLTSMSSLTLIYYSQARCDDAEALHKQTSALRERYLGTDHPSTLASIHNLAIVYQLQQCYALYQQALAGSEKCLGADHPHTLVMAENLANLFWSSGRRSESEYTGRRHAEASEQGVSGWSSDHS